MLRLSLLRRLGHGLVQCLDTCLHGIDICSKCSNAILRTGDGGLCIRERALEALLLVISGVKLHTAVLLLVVVIHLLLLEILHHAINHGSNLLETSLLAVQRHHQEVETAAITSPRAGQSPCGAPCHHQGAHPLRAGTLAPDLHEADAGGRQGLLKELQSVIIVENLNGLGQGGELVGAHLHPLIPLRGLRSAALLELCLELLVLEQRRLCAGEAVLHLLNCNTQLAHLLSLLLDGLDESVHFLLLGGHERLVGSDGSLLRGGGLREALPHLIAQLLQDPGDLPALRGVSVALLARKEGKETLPVQIRHLAALAENQPSEGLGSACLQETPCSALLECSHGALDGSDVGIGLPLLCGIGCGVLLAELGGLCHGLLSSASIQLRLLQLFFHLHLSRAARLDVLSQCRCLGLGSCDALAERASAGLAVALELLIKLLLLFTLCHDLRLHCLEHGHHLPDRVCGGGRAFTLFDGLQCQRRGH
mmetsp:Transcript_50378/g.107937  ORF Transcript_50378/g.107937 Transcript_50378/m.107937 type:complete len:479 (-) Transcript_50378:133-1569(-)